MYKNSVLIVEDQYIMAHVMVQKLTQLGFIMAHAHTGESAIEKLKDKAFYFILMDIELGKGINGIVTTQKLDSSENPKRINELIDIIYLKKGNEYQIMINSEFWKTYFPMIFIIAGFLFSGIGIIWLTNKI